MKKRSKAHKGKWKLEKQNYKKIMEKLSSWEISVKSAIMGNKHIEGRSKEEKSFQEEKGKLRQQDFIKWNKSKEHYGMFTEKTDPRKK